MTAIGEPTGEGGPPGQRSVLTRPVAAIDEPRLAQFLAQLDPASPLMRLLSTSDARAAAWRAARPPNVDGASVVAEARDEVVALGSFARLYGPLAELALEVTAAWRSDGVAAMMLKQLATLAEASGITSLLLLPSAPDADAVELAVGDLLAER